MEFENLQEEIKEEKKKKVLEEISVDKWCFLVKTLTVLLLIHYRTQNANNACMSYKNEVKMYSSSQPQESRLDSPNISLTDQTLYFLKKSDNLQYNMLVRWANGTNDSSTKRLAFQVFFFHAFL